MRVLFRNCMPTTFGANDICVQLASDGDDRLLRCIQHFDDYSSCGLTVMKLIVSRERRDKLAAIARDCTTEEQRNFVRTAVVIINIAPMD